MLTGGRLAAGVLMAFAMSGAMVTYLDLSDLDRRGWPLAIIAAGIVGLWGGWKILGRDLGRPYMSSGFMGVGAGAVCVIVFAVTYGIRSAYLVHNGVQFGSATDVVGHVLSAGVSVLVTLSTSEATLVALVAGSLIAGILAEFFNRIWR